MTNAGRKALIIEDDLRQAEIFSEALGLAGFESDIIADGATAALRLESEAPALILLDLHLPRLRGDKLLELIRAREHLKATRVILATADPHLAETLRESSDLALIKPVSFNQLCDLAMRLFKSND